MTSPTCFANEHSIAIGYGPCDGDLAECDTCGVSTCDECAVGHSGSHSPDQHAVPLCVLEEDER